MPARVPGVLRWLAGLAGMVCLFVPPWLATVGGAGVGLGATAILPLTLGFALVGWAVASGAGAGRSVAWLGVAAVGQASGLLLTRAGTPLRYQHFVPFDTPGALAPILQMILLLQLVAVGLGLVRLASRFPNQRPFSRGSALLIGGAWLLASATISQPIIGYPLEMAMAFLFQVVQLGTVVLAVTQLPPHVLTRWDAWVTRRVENPNEEGEAPDPRAGAGPAVLYMAGLATIAAAVLAILVYQRHPHVPDEVVYLFQARTFAAGKMAVPTPVVPEAFEMYLMEFTQRGWFGVAPPGWPALLSMGVFVGVPWLLNPLLTGLNVLLAFLFLRTVFPARTARLTAILLAVAPWQLFLGMSYMAHQATLALALLATLGLVKTIRTGAVRWVLLGGLALGWIGVTRQLDGLIMAVALGLWALSAGWRRRRPTILAGLVTGALVGGAPLLAYNTYFTGSPTTFPVMAQNDRLAGPHANAYGFGPDRGMGWALDPRPGHDVLDGFLNTHLNLTAAHADLFGWSTGSLLLIFIACAGGLRHPGDRLMAALTGLVMGAYFLNYFSGGPDFGPRYWHLTVVPLAALTVRGAEGLVNRLGRTGPRGIARGGVLAGIGVLCLSSLLTYVPWRSLDKYQYFRGMRPDLRTLAADGEFVGGLVLVEGESMPDLASALPYNPLDVNAQGRTPVFAWDRSPAVRERLMGAYPDRPVWLVKGPSVTGAGYQVVGLLRGQARHDSTSGRRRP